MRPARGAQRLDMLVSTAAGQALRRIARHQGETLTAALELLVLAEDERIGRTLTDEAFEDYMNRGVTR